MADVRASWAQLEVPDPIPFGPGYPPGSVYHSFPAFPDLGSPVACNRLEPGGPVVVTPLLYRWCLPNGRLNAAAPADSTPDFATLVLGDPTRMLESWRQKVSPLIPGLIAGPGTVNPGGGNLTIPLALPDEGPSVPAVALVYNSRTPTDLEAGWGWSVCPKQVVTSLTTTAVDLDSGDGTILRYNDKDVNGWYRGPGGTIDALWFDETNGTWIRIAADGSSVHFGPADANGTARADSFRSPTGDSWALAYDSGGRLSSIQDPFGQRTTLAYDPVSLRLRLIQQPSGRRTTVMVNSDGDLVGVIRPDATRVTMSYDANHRLTHFIDLRGKTTEYRHFSSMSASIGGSVPSNTLKGLFWRTANDSW